MTTLANLITLCRTQIGDLNVVAPVFPDDALTGFINRAIADLNAHFPRRLSYTIAAQAGVHFYALESVHQQVLAVEFPAGKTPPVYLRRLACSHPAFWKSAGYYDYLPSNDAASLNAPRLALSAAPRAGQTIALELAAEHGALLTSSAVTTVPERFLHLIALFVRWKTWESLASQEGMDPNPLKASGSTHGLTAARAEAAYRAALAVAKDAYTESAVAAWSLPGQERIY